MKYIQHFFNCCLLFDKDAIVHWQMHAPNFMTKVHDLEQQLEKLIAQLKGFQSGGKFTEKEISAIQDQLHSIDEQVGFVRYSGMMVL